MDYIRADVIKNMPSIEMSSFSTEENNYINDWIKYLMQFSMENNRSLEVGVLLDRVKMGEYELVTGSYNSVVFNTDRAQRWFRRYDRGVILIHTHPSNKTFSERDLINFARMSAIGIMIAVCNNGNVYIIEKHEGFDNKKFIRSILDIIEECNYKYNDIRISRILSANMCNIGYKYELYERW